MDSTSSPTKSDLCILFVGSNPSNASATDAAFYGTTKSSVTLTKWIEPVEGLKMYINVLPKKTESNRPLKDSEITEALPALSSQLKGIKPDRVVALGKTASKALTLLGVAHYEMPHPSGRNRKLNDPAYVAEKVKGMIDYVNHAPKPAIS